MSGSSTGTNARNSTLKGARAEANVGLHKWQCAGVSACTESLYLRIRLMRTSGRSGSSSALGKQARLRLKCITCLVDSRTIEPLITNAATASSQLYKVHEDHVYLQHKLNSIKHNHCFVSTPLNLNIKLTRHHVSTPILSLLRRRRRLGSRKPTLQPSSPHRQHDQNLRPRRVLVSQQDPSPSPKTNLPTPQAAGTPPPSPPQSPPTSTPKSTKPSPTSISP